MILGKVAKPTNFFHVALIAVMLLGMAYCFFFQKSFFGIDEISTQAMMLLVVFLIATEGLFRYVYKFTSLCGRVLNRESGKRSGKNKKHRKKIKISWQ